MKQTSDLSERRPSRIPEDSFLFEKLIPTSLIIMAILTAGFILFALGVIIGLVKF
jgi:hypothetical protein